MEASSNRHRRLYFPMSTENAFLDLDAYFERIDFAARPQANLETLRALQTAHATHIPFENLDVLLGKPIRIDLEGVQEKLVRGRRGGYCFEQNALFSAALENLGFAVTRLLGRVRLGTTRVLPRTHMMLKVELDGASWITDAGFGGWGLIEPILLEADREFVQGAWTYHLVREGAYWALQCPACPSGPNLYAFTLEPQLPVDYEPANHYTSTHPNSRFVQTLTVQLPSHHHRRVLVNRELRSFHAEGVELEVIPSEEALLEKFAHEFGLRIPLGTRFRPTMEASGAVPSF